jgi:deazaflavin-dependent oxidoreductase (nitroreductase family)
MTTREEIMSAGTHREPVSADTHRERVSAGAHRALSSRPAARHGLPRGLLAGTSAALALAWGMYLLNRGAWPGVVAPITQSAVYLTLGVITIRSRRAKVAIVRTVQRFTINPLMRAALWIGVNPLGLAILETRGRTSHRPRRTPVGNGRQGDTFWIIAEHGERAGFVRNIRRDPHVRVRLRLGLRYRWVPGIAEVLPDDDPLARQRRIARWHPLRMLNAINVRVLGADLVSVRVRLQDD